MWLPVTAVFLDIGETLIDETRLWRLWSEWLGVPHQAFMRELESVIANRAHHREVFGRLQPGFDLESARAQRLAAGWPPDLASPEDVYPDAVPCLDALRSLGYRTGIAGNQPPGIEAALEAAGLSADVVASSSTWGVAKPDPAFFRRIVAAAEAPAHEIAYVGDRLDGDILPAVEAGMIGVFLRRGPWGRIHSGWPEAARAHLVIDSLTELPEALARFNARGARPPEAPRA